LQGSIPVINKLISAYRLATYDYFAFEVSPWDVPHWHIERDGQAISATLLSYREWDGKPLIYKFNDPSAKPKVYQLIETDELQKSISIAPTSGELELLDALNLMETGDYSGAVRRVTTAMEVIVEAVAGKAMEAAKGKQAAVKFLKDTRMRFDERVKRYQTLTGRKTPSGLLGRLKETRDLRHRIVHGGYRIEPGERGIAQKAVDTGRWTYNWFENDLLEGMLGKNGSRFAPSAETSHMASSLRKSHQMGSWCHRSRSREFRRLGSPGPLSFGQHLGLELSDQGPIRVS
jgi:hypothetical protein